MNRSAAEEVISLSFRSCQLLFFSFSWPNPGEGVDRGEGPAVPTSLGNHYCHLSPPASGVVKKRGRCAGGEEDGMHTSRPRRHSEGGTATAAAAATGSGFQSALSLIAFLSLGGSPPRFLLYLSLLAFFSSAGVKAQHCDIFCLACPWETVVRGGSARVSRRLADTEATALGPPGPPLRHTARHI
ncbi:hypothetical protein B296_00039881 [Ensete ventricosum]|uniref:Uncharacterized protein n=1 Tax=Ensete ventricosum TaxID=4639 RepID=A0A426YT38_ENSVE|nr:hypothetical protein B296_00039881 [Ensete ventricosum]